MWAEALAGHNGRMASFVDSRGAELARLAGLLADPTRATFCLALLDGRAWTAGELARHAGVAASTATEHLHRLTGAGLLVEQRQGRHRYVRVADAATAQLIEDLASRAGAPAAPVRSLRAATVSAALANGRTCYDHLAGRLGVEVTAALAERGVGTGLVTPGGLAWLTETVGLDLAVGRRPLVRECLDWTQRRPHLSGVVGARFCTYVLERGFVQRIGTSRAVVLTPAGVTALGDLLGRQLMPT